MRKFSLAIDQGTTSCRAILFDNTGMVIGVSQKEFNQIYPQPGYVEHDPYEILNSQIECIKNLILNTNIDAHAISCVGITNQRETCLIWDKITGKPISNAIVWQCRRTASQIDNLVQFSAVIRNKTGLIPDAYFSASKIAWLLDNIPDARNLANSGNLIFGTIDTWLIYNLTQDRNLFTEPSNASRTLLFNIHTLKWDTDLFEIFNIPLIMAPTVVDSNANFGHTNKSLLGFEAPILAVLGDQQSALFGQGCLDSGHVKCTYGTGSFVLVNLDNQIIIKDGLLTSVAWKLADVNPCYALEGANFIAGAIIKWLIQELKILPNPLESEKIANSVDNNGGVYFIPAFVGLGSPWWRQDIRGIIYGLTRGTNQAHIIRASLEAMAFQVNDIINKFSDHNLVLKDLRVDGAASNNNFLLQLQADLANIPVIKAKTTESTAWGVAALAFLTCGEIKNIDAYKQLWQSSKSFIPKNHNVAEYQKWKYLVEQMLKIDWNPMLN